MRAKVQKWGNSLGVRIPKTFAAETGIDNDAVVDMRVAAGKIILSLAKKKKALELSDLLRGVTKKNLHAESDFGKGIGREIW